MAEVLVYHHIQGLTEGVHAFADDLRQAGHTVHAPDLFDGRTFDSIEEGFGYAREAGLDAIREQGIEMADDLGPGLVYGGFSFGVTIAQQLAQTRPGARGALLVYSCLPVAEFAGAWPEGRAGPDPRQGSRRVLRRGPAGRTRARRSDGGRRAVRLPR